MLEKTNKFWCHPRGKWHEQLENIINGDKHIKDDFCSVYRSHLFLFPIDIKIIVICNIVDHSLFNIFIAVKPIDL